MFLLGLGWVALIFLGACVGHLVETWALQGEAAEWRDGGGE